MGVGINDKHLVKRSEKLSFMECGTTEKKFVRMEGFTDLGFNHNAKEYSRQYVDEDTERTDTSGYSESISYKFDRYKDNPVLEELVEITEEEKIGNDAVRRILTVDLTTGSAIPGSSSDPNSAGLGRICSGYVRDYAVVPNSNGDSTDCMTYSGDFKSRGKKTKLAKISVSADGQTASFEE